MASESLGVVEAVTTMASKNTYGLDDLESYTGRRASELFKNKEEVLSLFNDAHFEERNIRVNEGTGDFIQDKVLRVGNWGRYDEEELWAGRIDGKVIYCRGTSGETLSIPLGASSNPFKFGYCQHYFKNDKKPLCFVGPKTIPQSGDPTKTSSQSELTVRTGEFLDLLVEILYLRHQLIDEIPDNKGGFLYSWFKNLCMLLHNGNNPTSTTGRDKSLAVVSGSSRSLKRPRLAEGQDSGRASRASRASTPVDPSAYEASQQTFAHIFDRNTVLEEENMSLQTQLHDSQFQQDEMIAEIGELKRQLEQAVKQKTKAEEKNQSLVQLFKETAKTAEEDSQSRVQAGKDAAQNAEEMIRSQVQVFKNAAENAAEEFKSRAQIFKDAAKKAEGLAQGGMEKSELACFQNIKLRLEIRPILQ